MSGRVTLPKPKIRFMSSNEFNFGSRYNSPNVSYLGEGVYRVPKGMNGCVLVCNASYPSLGNSTTLV